MRLVCPKCKSDDRLYSIETADLMYQITASTDVPRINYTGTDPIVLDDGTQYEGRIYCRADQTGLRHDQLLLATTCTQCGVSVYCQQNTSEQIMTGGGGSWKDAAGIPLCAGQAEPHQVAG